MSAEQQPTDPPPTPPTPTPKEFAGALKQLRAWAGLTLDDLAALAASLKVSTSSDYERGLRVPRWEWLHAFVTACLTHPKSPRQPLAAGHVHSELEHWQTAWTHARRHPTDEPDTADRHEPDDPEPSHPEPPPVVDLNPPVDTAGPPVTGDAQAPAVPVALDHPAVDPEAIHRRPAPRQFSHVGQRQ